MGEGHGEFLVLGSLFLVLVPYSFLPDANHLAGEPWGELCRMNVLSALTGLAEGRVKHKLSAREMLPLRSIGTFPVGCYASLSVCGEDVPASVLDW